MPSSSSKAESLAVLTGAAAGTAAAAAALGAATWAGAAWLFAAAGSALGISLPAKEVGLAEEGVALEWTAALEVGRGAEMSRMWFVCYRSKNCGGRIERKLL